MPDEHCVVNIDARTHGHWSLPTSDSTIAEKFNTYRFVDYKEKVIDLLKRVTTVGLGTQKVVDEMSKAQR